MRILGIDPGSSATGYGVVERSAGGIVHIAHGTIRTPNGRPLEERLAVLYRELSAAVDEYRPERAVVERVFVAANARSAIVLGQARGALLAVLGVAGVPVDEFTPREIKKAVTGSGAADKIQVQDMVTRLLSLAAAPPQDAADALAAALCRAQMGRLAGLDLPARSRRPRARSRRTLVPNPKTGSKVKSKPSPRLPQ
jgi:crossover junction endodeoxyribonuclease RuvC